MPGAEPQAGQPNTFPWGERNPDGGFLVGDYVGLIYSDHDEYIFDNPVGIVTEVEDWCDNADHDDPCGCEQGLTVQVDAQISAHRVFLIDRKS